SGALCPRLLADLGADVVRVEPPQGGATRRIGPFIDGQPDREASATDWYYNSNKRGVVLEGSREADRARLRSLVAHADGLVESERRGMLAALGLDARELARELPRLIAVSITPFGRSGPRVGWRGSELVCAALGGIVYVNGRREEPPLAPFGLQAYHSAS